MGIPPENAAVSLNAAKEALLKIMPTSKADAMTQTQLLEKAIVPSRWTGGKALSELMAAGKVRRLGKGGPKDLFRYFAV